MGWYVYLFSFSTKILGEKPLKGGAGQEELINVANASFCVQENDCKLLIDCSVLYFFKNSGASSKVEVSNRKLRKVFIIYYKFLLLIFAGLLIERTNMGVQMKKIYQMTFFSTPL